MIHNDDDNWPPYSSEAWQEFAKKESFNSKPCGPEHPQGMAWHRTVKLMHASLAEGKDQMYANCQELSSTIPRMVTGHPPTQGWSPTRRKYTANSINYCHTRLHLGFSAKLRIWQVSACKMEPRSGIIIGQNLYVAAAPTRPDHPTG